MRYLAGTLSLHAAHRVLQFDHRMCVSVSEHDEEELRETPYAAALMHVACTSPSLSICEIWTYPDRPVSGMIGAATCACPLLSSAASG